jgi:hypothetical protein
VIGVIRQYFQILKEKENTQRKRGNKDKERIGRVGRRRKVKRRQRKRKTKEERKRNGGISKETE